MYQQFWGYKVEEKLYLGVREQKKKVEYHWSSHYTDWANNFQIQKGNQITIINSYNSQWPTS
jgi:hypothetical protein